MKKLEEKEIDLLNYAIDIAKGHITDSIRTRLSDKWKWENVKDSNLCGFETQTDYEKWVNELNDNDKMTIAELETIQDKLFE